MTGWRCRRRHVAGNDLRDICRRLGISRKAWDARSRHLSHHPRHLFARAPRHAGEGGVGNGRSPRRLTPVSVKLVSRSPGEITGFLVLLPFAGTSEVGDAGFEPAT